MQYYLVVRTHTGQCKSTGGCYNELVVAIFRTGTAVKGKQEISLKKIFGGSQILTILTQLSDEIPLYSLSLHAGKGCSV